MRRFLGPTIRHGDIHEKTDGHSSVPFYRDGLGCSQPSTNLGVKLRSWVQPFKPSLADSTADRSLRPRTPILRKPNHPISATPPLLPLPPSSAGTVLSSIFRTQIESNDGALKDIGPGPSCEGKIYANTGDGRNGMDTTEREIKAIRPG